MPHLAVFREGWKNERFAELVLSQIAFIGQPTTVPLCCAHNRILSQDTVSGNPGAVHYGSAPVSTVGELSWYIQIRRP
jgi:hypothetical protein